MKLLQRRTISLFKHHIITAFLHLMGAHETLWLREQNGRLWYALRRLERENNQLEVALQRWKRELKEVQQRCHEVTLQRDRLRKNEKCA